MYVTYGNTNLSTLGGLTGASWCEAYRQSPQVSPIGLPDLETITMDVAGLICLDPESTYNTAQAQTAINSAAQTLKSALSTQGQDLVFRKSDGSPTTSAIINSQSVGGIRIDGVTIANTTPADFVTGLTWKFTASAVFDDPQASDLIDYREEVKITGGYPRVAFQETAGGEVLAWTLANYTVGTMIQSGIIVGRTSDLVAPLSIAPGYLILNESEEGLVTPAYVRGVHRGYQRSWRYVHKKSGPFTLPVTIGRA